jgi:hypothetical protein
MVLDIIWPYIKRWKKKSFYPMSNIFESMHHRNTFMQKKVATLIMLPKSKFMTSFCSKNSVDWVLKSSNTLLPTRVWIERKLDKEILFGKMQNMGMNYLLQTSSRSNLISLTTKKSTIQYLNHWKDYSRTLPSM